MIIVVGFNLLCGTALVGLAYGYERKYEGRLFPGITVDGVLLGGKTKAEAKIALQDAIEQRLQGGLVFQLGDRRFTVPTTVVATDDPDLTRDYIRFDADKVAEEAYHLARSGRPFSDAFDRIRLRFSPIQLGTSAEADIPGITQALSDQLKELTSPVKEATLSVRIPAPNKPIEVVVEAEQVGRSFDVDGAVAALATHVKQLDFSPVQIRETRIEPSIRKADIDPLVADVPKLLSHTPFKLTAEDRTWTVTSATVAGWINVTGTSGNVTLGLDPARLEPSVSALVADALKPSQDGKLTLEEGKLKEFVAPVEGIALDTAATINNLEQGWRAGSSTIAAALRRTTPKILGEDAEKLGIRELLGVGRSAYDGSPSNRRFNIAFGAKKVNGTLVGPGEEFSMLKTLGHVDGANGWLPELVIKGDKTTPEYGGGLCQVGTTMFRATLAAGMPVVERRNHSYRVRYYEPAGTDATIYEPAPDYRWKNDTAHWVLVTTENKANRLAFSIWGTRDGRLAEQTTPKVYNIVSPPPKKIVETTDLAPGQTKCTEVAHAGADASFDYTVTYASGEVKKETFKSHYRPWGAVCLVGVEKLTAPAAAVDETGVNNPN
jgi:vancomycin resistance protein YoaR